MVTKELSDSDIVEIWRQGLKKESGDLLGIAQYRLPSGLIRLVYTLKEPVRLAEYIADPFFTYRKTILGDVNTYTCKVLHLHTIQQANVGSEVIHVHKIF